MDGPLMLTTDESAALAAHKFRDLYPEGLIPPYLDEEGVLGITPSLNAILFHVTYWFEGEKAPFYLFQVKVDRQTGQLTVPNAEDWTYLKAKKFSESQSF